MKRTPMSSLRKTSLLAGVISLLTFVSIPTLTIYSQVKGANYIIGSGPDTPAIIGGILEIIVALAGIGTAVVLFQILRKQNERLAPDQPRLTACGTAGTLDEPISKIYFINI